MSKVKRTLERIVRGRADANLAFRDLVAVLRQLGFEERIRGDHHIFTKGGIEEILNLQPRRGQAKPYQVKQVRGVITAHGLVDERADEQAIDTDTSQEASDNLTEDTGDGD